MPDIRAPEEPIVSPLQLLTSGTMRNVADYLLARTLPLGDELIRALLYNVCNEIAKIQKEKADKR